MSTKHETRSPGGIVTRPLCLIGALAAGLACGQAALAGESAPMPIAGTYYLALDAEPFDLPPGTNLPGVATFHSDRTFMIEDGGDFGGLPFEQRDLAQLGNWRRQGNGIQAVSLFLQADTQTGDVLGWVKVHLELTRAEDGDLAGKVNTFSLACDEPAPFPVFGCPDPIASSADFVVAGPPDVGVTLRRLPAEFVLPGS